MIRTGNMRKLTYKNERLDSSCQRSRVSRSDREVSRNGANARRGEGAPEALTNRAVIGDLIGAAGLPAIHRIPKFVDAGHLMAYSIDVAELNKRAANTIDASFAVRSKLEVRVFHQPQDREGAWHRRPGNAAGQRRRFAECPLCSPKSGHSRTASFRPEAALVPKFNSRSVWFCERNGHAARSPSPRPAAQLSKSSSPRGAFVFARCRNCGAW